MPPAGTVPADMINIMCGDVIFIPCACLPGRYNRAHEDSDCADKAPQRRTDAARRNMQPSSAKPPDCRFGADYGALGRRDRRVSTRR